MRPGDFDDGILEQRSHRPWPMPHRPWLMTQTWRDLLFAHWPVEPRVLRRLVPSPFELDDFHGDTWLGIVPFRMANVSLRGAPALPWLSAFPELNVRTYVRLGARPGVFFFSLDASRLLAVAAARALLNLPYHRAAMRVTSNDTVVKYDSRRSGDPHAVFDAMFEPAGAMQHARPGTLEHFLTERYCLYNVSRRGRPYRLEIHHPPWPLQPAHASIARNGMAEAAGVALPVAPPLLHFSTRQDVVAWEPDWL